MQILYTAAHAHFPDTEPLGGGKAVADYFQRECPEWTFLSPRSLGVKIDKPLSELSELQYARFCRQFEQTTTAEILRHDPRDCIVLANDISEGPNLAELGARGYRVVTIWHVDVVEYFTKFYLHNLIRPETLTRFHQFRFLPDMLRLVFQKQYECVRHSIRQVVPSEPMKAHILKCYPWYPPEQIIVLPWGNIAPPADALPSTLPLPDDDEFVIMTLSRLSPEKGIERLFAALPFVQGKIRVWICGGPAYMQGKRYEKRLRQMADNRVEFLGHVTGAKKTALLQRADLFVSPSRHESYGLTIAEAEAAGCPVISHSHHGARGRVVNCENPQELASAITELVRQGKPSKVLSAAHSQAAAKLKVLLEVVASTRQ